ncbi:hypothetical protein ACTA71_004196 [Dictyostelium dimigraforme]
MRFRRPSTHQARVNVREGTYIKRLLKQVNPSMKIQQRSVLILTSLIRDTTINIMNEAFHLLQIQKKRTLTAREIQTSVRLFTIGEISKHAVSEGVKRVSNFHLSKSTPPTPPSPSSTATTTPTKIGIPETYLKSKVKQMNYNYRISKVSMAYLSAVLEYLVCEILELSANNSIVQKRTLISPRDILLAIGIDSELSQMYGHAIIAGGGTLPTVHPMFTNINMN